MIRFVLAFLMSLSFSTLVGAQTSASDPRASRTTLAARASQLEAQIPSEKAEKNKATLLAELAEIRSRLTDGDFKVGDLFVITLQWETLTSDTASVREGLLVSVKTLPDFSVRGVLRSELTEQLNAHVSRFLKNATVRTNVLMRISVVGAVGRPGYYNTSQDRPISELLMLAGGPVAQAKLDELEIRRAGKTVLTRKNSKRAILEGRTLEQLGVQSGDEVVIPITRKFNWQQIIQVLLVFSTLVFSFLQFIQWYYGRQE